MVWSERYADAFCFETERMDPRREGVWVGVLKNGPCPSRDLWKLPYARCKPDYRPLIACMTTTTREKIKMTKLIGLVKETEHGCMICWVSKRASSEGKDCQRFHQGSTIKSHLPNNASAQLSRDESRRRAIVSIMLSWGEGGRRVARHGLC
jgi:hypothetical protein